VQKEVKDEFMPWVMDAVVDQLANVAMSRTLADGVIGAAMQLSVEKQRLAMQKKESELRRKQQEAEEAEKKRKEEEERRAAEAAAGDEGEGE
jgi:hypothetical protein